MSEEVDRYLAQSYRHDILGESVRIEMPAPDPKLISEVKARIAKIDALRLGASLVSRDSVSYQDRRALVALLARLEAQQEAQKDG
jgi:hypothetical protein